MKDRKILVGGFPSGRLKDFLRITITTQEQMDTLVESLKDVSCDFAPKRDQLQKQSSFALKTAKRNQL